MAKSIPTFESLIFYNHFLVRRDGQWVLKLVYYQDESEIYFLNDGEKVSVAGHKATVKIGRGPQLLGTDDRDILVGTNGNNEIFALRGDDTIFAFSGHDLIYADAGADFIFLGAGNDTAYGGDGNDFISGEDGNDLLYGEDGNDDIWGDRGNDTIYGGSGRDTLSGDAGNDLLYVQAGQNAVTGDKGFDTLDFSLFRFELPRTSPYHFTGIFIVEDTGGISAYRSLVKTNAGFRVVSGIFSGIERLIGTDLDDRILLPSGIQSLNSGRGNDVIEISAVNIKRDGMVVEGGEGDDLYIVYFNNGSPSGSLNIKYSSGRDRLEICNVDEIKIDRDKRDILISVRDGNEISMIVVKDGWQAYETGHFNILRLADGRNGGVSIKVSDDSQPSAYLNKSDFLPTSLIGGRGADLITNSLSAYDWTADSISQSIYQNSLCTMTGGSGADNFLLWSGGVITDFNGKEDTLVFSSEMFVSLDDVKNLKRTQFGNSLIIDTKFKIPSGLPDVNQPIRLTLQNMTERDFINALDTGHVRVQSLAGASAASLGF